MPLAWGKEPRELGGAGRHCPSMPPARRHESLLDLMAPAQCERGKPQGRASSGVLLSKNRGVRLHGPGRGGGGQEGRAAAPSPPSEGAGQREAPGHTQSPSFIFPPRPSPRLSGRRRPSLLALDERSKRTVRGPVRPGGSSTTLTCIMRTCCFRPGRDGAPGRATPLPSWVSAQETPSQASCPSNTQPLPFQAPSPTWGDPVAPRSRNLEAEASGTNVCR